MVKLISLTKTPLLIVVIGVVKWSEIRVYERGKKCCIDIPNDNY